MRVLIVGASGMIGRHLLRDIPMIAPAIEVIGTYNSHALPQGIAMDITDVDSIARGIAESKADIILWLAGSKDVAALERTPDLSLSLNERPIVDLISLLGSSSTQPRLIYISSDYVFAGRKGHYRDCDDTAPDTVYGLSKQRAEHLIATALPGSTALRTSAVMSSQGGFLAWLMGELRSGNQVTLFDNAAFSPTPPLCLSRAVVALLRDDSLSGPLNFAGPRTTRFDFGKRVCEMFGFSASLIQPAQVDFAKSLLKPDLSLLTSERLSAYAPDTLDAFAPETCS
ncbi:sugar nucleotide-binding protein [Rhizorhabdus sp.]|uniref:SDR family oxidoreductase n=1 Tax=Rhizorhabdus sp. TaxID=1968843 RepID=UPI001B73BC64|nr:sugar nucleotide-binding protein [Rhizorhabdus sp.]MBP8232610.1 sugar nucleotide-binding protein [Rhizorhabdus sp.]